MALAIAGAVLGACSGGETETTETPSSTEAVTTEPTSSSEPSDSQAPSTTDPIQLEQLAIWPSASEVFATPREVAEDFLLHVFGLPPVIGEFMAGDSRSGEIEVFSPGDVETLRAILLVRQLGPNNGWFIIGTLNDNAVITKPVYGAEVSIDDVSSLVVEGMAEGFEASLTVYAHISGSSDVLDQETTMGGNLGVPGPFQVTLDLTGVQPGDTVMLLIRGGVGLETDPGEFGAIPILITE
ncbi:MAG: hypothetical protein RLZ37_1095 [Actinomycetota bacterium]|jgi:hypothetical protein